EVGVRPRPPLGAAVSVDAGQAAAGVLDLRVIDAAPEGRRGERHDLGGREELALPRQLRERVERAPVVAEAEVPRRPAQGAVLDEDVARREPPLVARWR